MSEAALTGAGTGGGRAAAGRGAARPRPTGRPRLVLRMIACAIGIVLALVVLRHSTEVRDFEAWLSGRLVPRITGIKAGASADSPIVWFQNGPRRYMGLLVTSECTVSSLIIPFIVGTTWVIWRQAKFVRPLLALAVAVSLLFSMNQVRLLLIIVLTVRFGNITGFYWGHTLIGSLVTIFGGVLIFLIYILIVLRKGSVRSRGRHVYGRGIRPVS